MNITIDFVAIVQVVTAVLVGAGVKALFRMSNCMAKLLTWKEEHTKQEQEWHEENQNEHAALRGRLDRIINGG